MINLFIDASSSVPPAGVSSVCLTADRRGLMTPITEEMNYGSVEPISIELSCLTKKLKLSYILLVLFDCIVAYFLCACNRLLLTVGLKGNAEERQGGFLLPMLKGVKISPRIKFSHKLKVINGCLSPLCDVYWLQISFHAADAQLGSTWLSL